MGKNIKKQKQVRFSDDELEMLERLKAKHGSYTSAIVAGLRMLDAGDNGQVTEAVALKLEQIAAELREQSK